MLCHRFGLTTSSAFPSVTSDIVSAMPLDPARTLELEKECGMRALVAVLAFLDRNTGRWMRDCALYVGLRAPARITRGLLKPASHGHHCLSYI
jgi:hypothetical protein